MFVARVTLCWFVAREGETGSRVYIPANGVGWPRWFWTRYTHTWKYGWREIRFSTGMLDQSILFRSELDEAQTPFHYLLGAWKRTVEMTRSLRQDGDPQAKDKLRILSEIRRLCVSYAGISLTIPEIFGYCPLLYATNRRNAPRETDLSSYLLQDIFTEVKLPEEFLNELANRFHDDGLVDVIGPTIIGISEEIGSIKFNEDFQSAIRVPPHYTFEAYIRQWPFLCSAS